MSEPTLIDSRLIRSGREELRIELSDYRGFTYIGMRRWYRDGEAWRPGKGLSVGVEQIPFLRVALEKAEARALDMGLLDEESYESAGLSLPATLGG